MNSFISASTSFKDRTNEFNTIAQFMKERHNINEPKSKQTSTRRNNSEIIRNTISINRQASAIGRRTSETAKKLKELTDLAKSRSPFENQDLKINQKTQEITHDINQIKSEIEELERVVSRNKTNNHTADHSTTVIRTLNTVLLKTTKDLNDALQMRTRTVRADQERTDTTLGSRRSGPAPVFRPAINMFDEEGETEDEIVIQVPQENNYLVHRANAVKDIEIQITEIQSIFKKLSQLVALQQEQILRIEDNVDTTIIHAESSLAQLLKYLNGISSNTSLILKAFALILFFMFLWFMVFA